MIGCKTTVYMCSKEESNCPITTWYIIPGPTCNGQHAGSWSGDICGPDNAKPICNGDKVEIWVDPNTYPNGHIGKFGHAKIERITNQQNLACSKTDELFNFNVTDYRMRWVIYSQCSTVCEGLKILAFPEFNNTVPND